MVNIRYSVTVEEYEKIIQKLKELIRDELAITFAYLHGSFLEKRNFGDLDLAVFVEGVPERESIDFEAEYERILSRKLRYPTDVRILNSAPPGFCYQVVKNGVLLADRNENKRVEFETQTYQRYFDFLPFRRSYLKEVLRREI